MYPAYTEKVMNY